MISRPTQTARLDRAGFAYVSGWLPREEAEAVAARIEEVRFEVDTIRGLAAQPIGRQAADRAIDESDIAAAARGLKLTTRSPAELRRILHNHSRQPIGALFASKVIVMAVKRELSARGLFP